MSLPYFENEPVIHRECIAMHEKVLLYANELVLLGKSKLTTLYQCEPPNQWFTHLDESNHHGKSHVAQLLDLGAFSYPYCKAIGLEVDMVVVGWTSILHDIAQWNNSEEAMEAHPKLAADWARAHLPGIIDSDRLAKIVQTIELHSLTPEHNSQPMSNELRLFRSLDAAALVRLGMDTTQFHLPISLLEEGELAPPGLSLPCMAQRLETTYRKLEESTRQFEVGYNLEPNRFIQMVNAGVLCNIVLPL